MCAEVMTLESGVPAVAGPAARRFTRGGRKAVRRAKRAWEGVFSRRERKKKRDPHGLSKKLTYKVYLSIAKKSRGR
ncbi:hypothetical protein KSC_093950 [Ktedonobacter sp. SOSP1-52]|nr:hypothetical protein KSC_073400 [Ktedonobacter sp. SOSP1-52]GHO70503.1 hypothetical protein KSC_093950 [Ktedonobacter sp. SOSP1-52]